MEIWIYYIPLQNLLNPSVYIFANNISLLPGYYQELDNFISSTLMLPKDRIYITEIPDLTRNENGEYCCSGDTEPYDPVPPNCNSNPFVMIPYVTHYEMYWSAIYATQQINSIIHDNTAKGWNVITGLYDDFSTHGYCSSDSYLVRWHDA